MTNQISEDVPLVERLRNLALIKEVPFVTWDVATEAADEIERLANDYMKAISEVARRSGIIGRAAGYYDAGRPEMARRVLDEGLPAVHSFPEPETPK